MAAVMRRALQQARAEAAAQPPAEAADTSVSSSESHNLGSRGSQEAPEAATTGRKGLATVLQKPAQKMQEEAAAAAPAQSSMSLQSAADATGDTAQEVTGEQQHALLSAGEGLVDDGVSPNRVQLSELGHSSGSSSRSWASLSGALGPGSQLSARLDSSLGDRLVSMLKSAQDVLSPSRQGSYIPVDAGSSTEPHKAEGPSEQQPSGQKKQALPRDASLGQRLGSLLSKALSLPRQSSYTPLAVEADAEAADSSHLPPALTQPSELSLTGKLRSTKFTGQSSHVTDAASDLHQTMPHELSLRSRESSSSLFREPSYSFLSQDSDLRTPPSDPWGVPPSQLGPSPPSPSRRPLPRDASYLPEWVNQSTGRPTTPEGDEPSSALGSSLIRDASVEEYAMPVWVDWPSTDAEVEQAADHQTAADDLGAPARLMMAPPHARGGHQETPASLPRVKHPLRVAPNPLSLSLVHTPPLSPTLDPRPQNPLPTPKGQRLFDFWREKADSSPVSAADQPRSSEQVRCPTELLGEQATARQASASHAPIDTGLSSQHAAVQTPIGTSPSSQHIALQALTSMSSPNQGVPLQAPIGTSPSSQHAALQAPPSPSQDVALQGPFNITSSSKDPTLSIGLTRQADPSPLAVHQPPFNTASASHPMPALSAPLLGPKQSAAALNSLWPASPNAASMLANAAQRELLAELTATSHLVQQQSARQAELLEGLQHALSHISQHRLLLQNPSAAAQDAISADAEIALHGHGERGLQRKPLRPV